MPIWRILPKINYELTFQGVSTAHPHIFRNAQLEFAVSSHSVLNFAIAVSRDGRKYAYSGDGNFNDHTRRLYQSCSLLVHEAYAFGSIVQGHAQIADLVRMAEQQKIKRLALTHIQREVRKTRWKELTDFVRNFDLT